MPYRQSRCPRQLVFSKAMSLPLFLSHSSIRKAHRDLLGLVPSMWRPLSWNYPYSTFIIARCPYACIKRGTKCERRMSCLAQTRAWETQIQSPVLPLTSRETSSVVLCLYASARLCKNGDNGTALIYREGSKAKSINNWYPDTTTIEAKAS